MSRSSERSHGGGEKARVLGGEKEALQSAAADLMPKRHLSFFFFFTFLFLVGVYLLSPRKGKDRFLRDREEFVGRRRGVLKHCAFGNRAGPAG